MKENIEIVEVSRYMYLYNNNLCYVLIDKQVMSRCRKYADTLRQGNTYVHSPGA